MKSDKDHSTLASKEEGRINTRICITARKVVFIEKKNTSIKVYLLVFIINIGNSGKRALDVIFKTDHEIETIGLRRWRWR